MCGRYSNGAEFSEIRVTFRAMDELFRPYMPRLNISPSFQSGWEVPIVIKTSERNRAARLARFWFIPEDWRRPLKALPPSFNARSETVFDKPMFRAAARERRCLVPATGWREFLDGQPYHFVPRLGPEREGQLFAFAGIWSAFREADGVVSDSFAILTTEPTLGARAIHDRMPLVLPFELHDAWLGSGDDADDGRALVEKARAAVASLDLEIFATHRAANDSRYEGPLAIAPVTPDPSAGTSRGAARARAPSPQLTLFDGASPAPRRRR